MSAAGEEVIGQGRGLEGARQAGGQPPLCKEWPVSSQCAWWGWQGGSEGEAQEREPPRVPVAGRCRLEEDLPGPKVGMQPPSVVSVHSLVPWRGDELHGFIPAPSGPGTPKHVVLWDSWAQ